MDKPDPVFGGLFASPKVHQQLGIKAPSAKVEAASEAPSSETKGEGVPAAPAVGNTGVTGKTGTDGSEAAKDDSSAKEE